MKSLKHNIANGLAALAVIAPLSVSALPIYMDTKIINDPNQPTTVSINNNSNIQFYNARIKLKAGDTWTDLGNITPGQNLFKINAPIDNTPEIFEVQLENGQWLFSTYEKNNSDTIVFNIEASQDNKFKAELYNKYHKALPALTLFSPNTHHVAFTPISTKLALNVWSITCADGGEAFEGIYCGFGTWPVIFYYGLGAGMGGGIATGGFSTSGHTPQELVTDYNYIGSTEYAMESEFFFQELEIIPIGVAILAGPDFDDEGGEGLFSLNPFS